MNEGDEEDINYRSATLKDAISALNKRDLIDEINKFAKSNNCRISICFPRKENKADEIHFSLDIIDSNQITTIGDKATISTYIADSIEYDKAEVNFRRCDQQTFDRLYKDVTLFALENYDNFHAFLKKHYHRDLQKDTDVIAHQDKRQRSASPPRSSLFSQNGNYQRQANNLPTPEVIAEFLETAPFWPDLSTLPEEADSVMDQGYRLARSRMPNQKQTADAKLTNAGPTGTAKM